ncbi:MAG: ABC transporter ATP-binding protein [SAR202 cluster bacterium]|nr:ABC transporter ATP-binding protein [SAR202 cluster bacterium]MDP6301745.1 ABC transporter ATP-binding protein [SAR202 cluster bacterium]MDP7103205.1 ABC transporter ATP-binding protein [SAR202 cluster bacterium]MDP7224665.1 ABC transporter ATP-binding protein [SAR202 cluster bacterium]
MASTNPGDRSLFRRLTIQARPYWGHISAILLLRMFGVPLALLTPLPVKIAVDSVVGSDPIPGFIAPIVPSALSESNLRLLAFAAGLQVTIVLLGQLQELGSYALRAIAGQGLVKEFRLMLFAHLQRLSLLYHDTHGLADSVYRIQQDAPAIREIAINSVIPTLASAVTLVSMVFVIVRIDWQLALVALAVSPVLFALARYYNSRMRGRYRDARRTESDSIRVVQEALGAFRVVKAFGREIEEQRRFEERADIGVRMRVRLGVAEGAFGLLVNVTIALGTALVLYVGVRNVLDGVLSLGDLFVVLAYIAQFYAPLRTISRQTAALQSSLVSMERGFDLLDETPDVVDPANPRQLGRAAGAVEFRNVSFAYGSGQDVLDDVSFRVEAGTRLGLSGRTGAGKTTVASLLPRFYDPTAGSVLIDGVDIREYSLADLRAQFAIVLQEPVLFSTTVSENIAYGWPLATQPEIEAAARAANIHEFVSGLPDGYETLVGERGMRLSGGERQRVALARAFLKDAPILILDEPTSSVDTRTEAGIMETMERLMVGRTTFMIAHRLSTLDYCNARMEIEDGVVVSASGSVEMLGLAATSD